MRMTNEKLAWLAGIWDGEGSIAMFERKENRKVKYCPTLVLSNTNEDIINEALKILDEIGASFHVMKLKPQNPKHRERYQLTTRNAGYIEKVLRALLPYLVGKKSQAEIMLRYLERRACLPDTHTHATERFFELSDADMRAIQALNHGNSELLND